MKQSIIHYLTLILALTGAVFAFGDQVQVLSFLSPELAHKWPFVLALATVVDRIGKIMLEFLNKEQPKTDNGLTRVGLKNPNLPAIAIVASLLLLSGCATGPDGQRRYTGPAITFGASYNGVSGTIHLDPSFAKQKK